MQEHVDSPDGRIRKRFVIAGLVDFLAFEGVIEFLHVLLRDEPQLFVPECGFDMIFDIAFITVDRPRTECRLSVFLEPLLHPLAESDFTVLREVNALIIFNRPVELRHQFLLRFGEHAFVDRQAVILVTDNNSAFPASISSFADKSVAVRSFSGHSYRLLSNTGYHKFCNISRPNHHNIHQVFLQI